MTFSVPKKKEIWWVSVTKNTYTPLVKKRVVHTTKKMVTLGTPYINNGDILKSYILSSVTLVEKHQEKTK